MSNIIYMEGFSLIFTLLFPQYGNQFLVIVQSDFLLDLLDYFVESESVDIFVNFSYLLSFKFYQRVLKAYFFSKGFCIHGCFLISSIVGLFKGLLFSIINTRSLNSSERPKPPVFFQYFSVFPSQRSLNQ